MVESVRGFGQCEGARNRPSSKHDWEMLEKKKVTSPVEPKEVKIPESKGQ